MEPSDLLRILVRKPDGLRLDVLVTWIDLWQDLLQRMCEDQTT